MSVKRLGKGLEALIRPEKESKRKIIKKDVSLKTGVTKINIKDITPNPSQPRRDFNQSALDDLTASIREKGVITPITVRQKDENYEIIAGERRWRASKKCRKKTIPAYVINVKNDAEMMEVALIENIQRENLNPLEESDAYALLNSKYAMSHESIAKAVGKKRATISNALRLLKLPLDIRKSLRLGEISAGHARAILQAKTDAKMIHIWKKVINQNLSVRNVEMLSKPSKTLPKKKINQRNTLSPQVRSLENKLIEILGTKVKLKPSKNGGFIEISYFSDDDLERLIDLMNTIS